MYGDVHVLKEADADHSKGSTSVEGRRFLKCQKI